VSISKEDLIDCLICLTEYGGVSTCG